MPHRCWGFDLLVAVVLDLVLFCLLVDRGLVVFCSSSLVLLALVLESSCVRVLVSLSLVLVLRGHAKVLSMYIEGPQMINGPPLSGHTYRYSLGTDHRSNQLIAYNSYARLLPKKALDVLCAQEPWSIHIGGHDLANTFAMQRNTGTYIPLVSHSHTQLVKTLREQSSFFLQPIPYDAPKNL